MPFVFSGLKAAIALAVVGAVVAEFVNADRGLGYMIISATAFFKVPLAWGALILLSIMGIVLFQVVVVRSEEHTSELQSLMRISYAVFCLKNNKPQQTTT